MLAPGRRLAPLLAVALLATGCSGSGSGDATGSATRSSASATPSSTVPVPQGVSLTDQGSKLAFGDSSKVVFESQHGAGTVLELTVEGVRRGRLADFDGFILDDAYKKKAAYYYTRVRVRNVGDGDVGGVPVPLWGVNADNVLLPAVRFTTRFARCPSKALPSTFGPGASFKTCLVYLSPNRSRLTGVSYRPSQQFDPIVWTGTVRKPLQPRATSRPTHRPTPSSTKSPKP